MSKFNFKKHLHKHFTKSRRGVYLNFRKRRKKFKTKPSFIHKYADKMRNNMTESEKKFYKLFLSHFKTEIRTQFIIDSKYIVDFFIPKRKIVVEVDGGYHLLEKQKVKDQEKNFYLYSHGFCVLRFTNEEVENESIKILRILKSKIYSK